jgi:hypothetical protein
VLLAWPIGHGGGGDGAEMLALQVDIYSFWRLFGPPLDVLGILSSCMGAVAVFLF